MNKTSVVLCMLSVLGAAPIAQANSVGCERTAIRAVERAFATRFFDQGKRIRKVENVVCERKISRQGKPYQACEVGASNGEGAGDITFGVMQSDDCSRAFSVFVIGEE